MGGNTINHSWPKFLTFGLALPFLPKAPSDMLGFMSVGLMFCLIIHHFAPKKVIVTLEVRR